MRRVLLLAVMLLLAGVTRSQAETSVECYDFRAAALGEGISSKMLFDGDRTARCLVSLIEEAGAQTPDQALTSEARELLVQSTGAMLRYFAMGNPIAQVQSVREQDSLAMTTALTYAARSSDGTVRRNASLVLANTIDNSTVCVPLDHLADPAINPNGRVNLLGVVSTVAPWAVAENYENIKRAALYFQSQSQSNPDLLDTAETVQNLLTRLRSQDGYDNSASKSGGRTSLLDECRSYQPLWATGTPYALTY